LIEKQLKEILNKKGLKPVDVYTVLEINKVVFYQTIRSSNLNNKTLHKILKYLDLEIEVLLHEKSI
jgi:predicted transcriptional regulator